VLSLKDDRELLDRITSTAELAWGLILACARRFPEAIDASRRGVWARDAVRGHQLAYKTLGVLGCGRLGTMVAAYAKAFRMHVLGCDVRPVDLPGVENVSFDRLFAESDIVSVHIHLTEENHRLINRDVLARMKPGSILINTSRGAIIDEAALLDALEHGPLAAAGLDVVEGEWRDDLDQHPLIAYAQRHGNLVVTPHVGGVTVEAQETAYSAAARKLAGFLESAQGEQG
jgi:D-3-phosphoglycerate dehydrogenase